jgi:galactokinase
VNPTIECNARDWLAFFRSPEAIASPVLRETYGGVPEILRDRCALHARVIEAFLTRFGDRPLRLFRAPARINLRGMHVDTHGGYLNLMTHQRETVIAISPEDEGPCRFANIDAAFPEVAFDGPAWLDGANTWEQLLGLRERVGEGWARYVAGAWLRAHSGYAGAPRAVHAVVGSDIPRGAGLSSSHALSLATYDAVSSLLGLTPDALTRIAAARDVEWFAGARTGTSDQGTMVLGRRGMLINAVLHPDILDLERVRAVPFPEELAVLVVDSKTQRNLSGAAALAYNRNRFAYSLALAVLQQVWRDTQSGTPPTCFAEITPEGRRGLAQFYKLMSAIPMTADLGALQDTFNLPDIEMQYARYFAHLPEGERPTHFDLRGPLLFGISESERARAFADAVEQGLHTYAGTLMNVGHDGDRVCWHGRDEGLRCPTNDVLEHLAGDVYPVALLPGKYEASSPALDALVDTATAAGAVGASLTGAGIAGCILALCRREEIESVAYELLNLLGSDSYAALAGLPERLDDATVDQAIVENQATAGAGEIMFS